MPLYLRRTRDHYPDDVLHERFPHIGWVVLSGAYVAGSIGPPTKRTGEGRWDWHGGFGPFGHGGTVDEPEQAKEPIAAAFGSAIARVGLAERADTKPGQPRGRCRVEAGRACSASAAPIPGRNRMFVFPPERIKEHRFVMDVTRVDEVAWKRTGKTEFMTSEEMAHEVAIIVFDLVGKVNSGKVEMPFA